MLEGMSHAGVTRDLGSLVCYRNGEIWDSPDSINVVSVSVGSEMACKNDRYGVVCWGEDLLGNTAMQPEVSLSSMAILGVGGQFACALDNRSISCWGRDELDRGWLIPPADLRLGDFDGDGITGDNRHRR